MQIASRLIDKFKNFTAAGNHILSMATQRGARPGLAECTRSVPCIRSRADPPRTRIPVAASLGAIHLPQHFRAQPELRLRERPSRWDLGLPWQQPLAIRCTPIGPGKGGDKTYRIAWIPGRPGSQFLPDVDAYGTQADLRRNAPSCAEFWPGHLMITQRDPVLQRPHGVGCTVIPDLSLGPRISLATKQCIRPVASAVALECSTEAHLPLARTLELQPTRYALLSRSVFANESKNCSGLCGSRCRLHGAGGTGTAGPSRYPGALQTGRNGHI